MRFLGKLSICLFLSMFSWSVHARRFVPPQKYAVILGNNRGARAEVRLHYAENDARKMAMTMIRLGGFPASNVKLLLEQDVDTVEQTLNKIRLKFIENNKLFGHKNNTLFLFYFSGHADAQALHLGTTRLSFNRLRQWLKKIPAQVRIGILDTCQSGQLIRKKGARRIARQVKIPSMNGYLTTEGEAIITSSGVDEDSHELEQLKGSIFTHYLVSGLHGAADQDKDGKVTLQEVYHYAYRRTISHTLFLSSGIQHPSFRNDLRGHGQLILTDLRKSSVKLHFGPYLSGTYYILDGPRKLLMAEISKNFGTRKTIALAQGRYIILKRGKGRVHVQLLSFKSKGEHYVTPKKMRPLSYLASAAKGLQWISYPELPQVPPETPMRTGFHISVGVAFLGLLSTGILYSLAFKYYGDDAHALAQGMRYPHLEETAETLSSGAALSLGVTITAGVSATVFYLLDRRHHTTQPSALASSSRTPSSPKVSSTLLNPTHSFP